jgi:hypothetical protein
MDFVQKLLQGIAFVPTIVNSVEGLFGSHSGEQKKESAISFVSAALQLTEAVANREIVDEIKFKSGLSKIIDGTVECLNASAWSHLEVKK